MVNKKFSILIYILSSVLVIILSMFIYRVITHISHDDSTDKINISKYTGERISNSSYENQSKIATFPSVDSGPSIVGLSSADVVFEFISNSSGLCYKAIFNKDATTNISSTIKLNNFSDLFLPTFNFLKSMEVSNTKNSPATSIFINFNDTSSSNFLYQNGEYSHYRGLELDDDNNNPVKLSNVIVQFIDGNITNDEILTITENAGTGLLFCSGTAQNIKWDRKKDTQIQITNQTGGSISLMPGHTWWVFIDRNSSIAYD